MREQFFGSITALAVFALSATPVLSQSSDTAELEEFIGRYIHNVNLWVPLRLEVPPLDYEAVYGRNSYDRFRPFIDLSDIQWARAPQLGSNRPQSLGRFAAYLVNQGYLADTLHQNDKNATARRETIQQMQECESGNYPLCDLVLFGGQTPLHGFYAELSPVHPEEQRERSTETAQAFRVGELHSHRIIRIQDAVNRDECDWVVDIRLFLDEPTRIAQHLMDYTGQDGQLDVQACYRHGRDGIEWGWVSFF